MALVSSLPDTLQATVIRQGSTAVCNGVTVDSRTVEPGSLFVALKGVHADGHAYIATAIERGAVCVVAEQVADIDQGDCTIVQVNDSHAALGELAAVFYRNPAREMCLIAVTGTNGKTTVSWMIDQMLRRCGHRVGVIGTINYRYRQRDGKMVTVPAQLTTPDPVFLQQLLRAMASQGVTHVVMETSSHALSQKRLQPIEFDIAVFTNLSRDHLDYHGSMEEYFAAKQQLFSTYLKNNGIAVIVTEECEQEKNQGQELVAQLTETVPDVTVISCGIDGRQVAHAEDLLLDINGFSCTMVLGDDAVSVRCSLTGRYNVLNVLAAAGVGLGLGLSPDQIGAGLAALAQVPGRMERVRIPGLADEEQPAVFVDYAHTPDALHNVLQTLKNLIDPAQRLICIFGCGGDRDRGKRPIMGEVVAGLADVAIVTSDNPRSEEPSAIIEEILPGLAESALVRVETMERAGTDQQKMYISLVGRKQAIQAGIQLAAPGDIVLIAGKGHEDYQLINGEKLFFDDRVTALDAMISWNRFHLEQATGAAVVSQGHQSALREVSTDTRTITKGNIFVALAGEKFDGHDYVSAAIDSGAKAVVVHKQSAEVPADVIVVSVGDTLKALGDMAAYRRQLLGSRVKCLAVTGSSGKTTVKEMTAAICTVFLENSHGGIDPVLKTAGNFNNLIGLPLSLLPLSAGHQMAVLEMGMNRPGEIARLCEIADPDIGCITNVQAAHLEGLGSIAGVARAKGELFSGMRKESIAVVNYDDRHVRRLSVNSASVIGFAVTRNGRRFDPEIRATRVVNLGEQGMRFTLHIKSWKKRITVPSPGEHNVSNCAAAAAICHGAGIDPESVVEGLMSYKSCEKRMQFMTLPGGINVVNDCYNANPSSMEAALRTVAGFDQKCSKTAVLGDMLELGEESDNAHEQLGQQVAMLGFDQLLVTGGFAKYVAHGAALDTGSRLKVRTFADKPEIVDWLYHAIIQGEIAADDWLLVKGSRGMQMEKIVEGLQQRFATGVERE